MRLINSISVATRALPPRFRAPLRPLWRAWLRREQLHAEVRFYSHFVRPGDLVFDIGANTGVKTSAFLRLGAHVVAVEPNPVCAERIVKRHRSAIRRAALHVEQVAVAAKETHVTLKVFGEMHDFTSGSEEFVSAVEADGTRSTSAITVEAVTVDNLIRRFGVPAFLKVDVEGMDAQVLRGLHHCPRLASFEFNTDARLWHNAVLCLREASRIGFQEANFTGPGTAGLLLPHWIALIALPAEISRWASGRTTFGDVFVR